VIRNRERHHVRPSSSISHKEDVDFRLVVSGTKISGWYRASNAEPWQKLGETDLPASGPAQIGLEACSGPSDKENWASFREFRIVAPPK